MRTRIKFCGFTREEDICYAVRLGVDAIGFVFWGGSPRAVSVEQAKRWVKALPPFVSSVGLFVNEQREVVRQIADEVGLTHLQFHGDETGDYCSEWDRPVIKAVRVNAATSILSLDRDFPNEIAFLLDSDHPGYGGSGQAFDWAQVPTQWRRPWVLAGGLDKDNVQQAIRLLQPWAVDVSSGIEERGPDSKPVKGSKCKEAMNDFVGAVIQANGWR